jgi:voltage-gated potassium channel
MCKKINRQPFDFVVIEKDPELIPVLEEDGMLYVSGDAADEANLLKAGIEKAKGLIAVLATDTDNVFLVLTARQLNANLSIMARAGTPASKLKLTAAGADIVESPYEMGAARMAQRIIRPAVTSFLDQAFADRRTDILMEEIPIRPDSVLSNVMLKDSGIRQKYNLIIIAIKQPDGEMQFNPSFESMLKPDHTVIAVGEEENLRALARVLNPS